MVGRVHLVGLEGVGRVSVASLASLGVESILVFLAPFGGLTALPVTEYDYMTGEVRVTVHVIYIVSAAT
jgi:hypothetical protein